MGFFLADRLSRSYHTGRYRTVRELIGGGRPKLLDIGCGRPCGCMEDGAFIRFMGFGTGLDVKDCGGGFDFQKGDLMDMRFADGSFDVVVAMEVLEHVTDLDIALSNIHRVLRDDGVFIMSTPNNNILWRVVWFLWARTFGRMWLDTHKTNVDERSWLAILGRRFDILEKRTHWGVNLIVKMGKKKNRG